IDERTLVNGSPTEQLPPLPDDDEWPTRGLARGIRLAVPVAALLSVLIVAAGFWGGAAVEKSYRSSSSAGAGSGLAARLRAAFANGGTGTNGGGRAGAASGFGGSAAAAAGTLSVVDGTTLYVSGSDGSLTKVTLGPSTTITRTGKAESNAL